MRVRLLAAAVAGAALWMGAAGVQSAMAASDDIQIWMADSPNAPKSTDGANAAGNAKKGPSAAKQAAAPSGANGNNTVGDAGSTRTDLDQEAVERKSRDAQKPKAFGAPTFGTQSASTVQKGGWGATAMAPFGSSIRQDTQMGIDAPQRVKNPAADKTAAGAGADAQPEDAMTLNARAKAQATLNAASGGGGDDDTVSYPGGRGVEIGPNTAAARIGAAAPAAPAGMAQAGGWPALPPLPGAGGVMVGAVPTQGAVGAPLVATAALAQGMAPTLAAEPALSMDQAPVPTGQEFARLEQNARAARLVPAGVPDAQRKKVEARIYQVAQDGSVSLALREQLDLAPNDPAKIDRVKKTPYAKSSLTAAKASDYSRSVSAGTISDVAQTGVRAGFLWRPALGGSWVEAAFDGSVLAGFDEFDSFNGHERTPRLAQRSALVDFDVSNSGRPQMAWLPADGADTLSGQSAGRSVYWLMAVGVPESFKGFDPKKAVADAKAGSL